jgi:hypothetical protein
MTRRRGGRRRGRRPNTDAVQPSAVAAAELVGEAAAGAAEEVTGPHTTAQASSQPPERQESRPELPPYLAVLSREARAARVKSRRDPATSRGTAGRTPTRSRLAPLDPGDEPESELPRTWNEKTADIPPKKTMEQFFEEFEARLRASGVSPASD